MEASLVELETVLHARRPENVQLSPAERRSLASLGYVASPHDDADDRARQSLPDIKDRLRYHEAVEDASRLLDENRPQEALAALEDVVAAVPDYLPARMFLGEALAKSGKLDEALQVFRALAELDPKHGEVHARLGWIQGQLGHHDEAMAELKQAVDLAPETAEYRVNLGSIFLELNHRDEALALFQSAIEADPAAGNFEIGKILASAGDLNGAIKCYKRTLETDPNWIHLHTEIAVLLARQKQFDEAIEHARRAVQLTPQNADAHYNLGVMFLEQGKFKNAEGPLEEALRLNPQHPRAARQLARAREAIGRRDGQPPVD
jgi:tetratricopeptide (TPR) repeat protein